MTQDTRDAEITKLREKVGRMDAEIERLRDAISTVYPFTRPERLDGDEGWLDAARGRP